MEKPIRILVVDDDPEVLRGTCRVMEKEGYTTLAASTGAEALQSVRSTPPQLVLLDRQLPDLEGLEVCRRIKEDPALRDVFVVIVSGVFTKTEEQITGLESGADGYIVRPVGHRELVARVQAFIRIARLTGALREQAENVRVRNVEIERLNEELRRELTERRRAEEALKQARDELEQRVTERTEALRTEITERKRAEQQLRELSQRLSYHVDHSPLAVTEVKRMEDTLRKESTLLRTVIDNIPYPIYAKDIHGRKIMANVADIRNIGASSEGEVLGKDDFALFPKAEAERFHAVDQTVMQTGKPVVNVEDAFKKGSGETVWLLSSKIPFFDEMGRCAGLVGIGTDITARKRAQAEKEMLEAQNRQLQKAESLGRMAGAIAHHFNNKLAAVMMNLNMAMRARPGNEGSAGNLAEAMEAARQAAEVSRLMLTYLGQTQGKFEPQDLAEVCRLSLTLLRTAMPGTVVLETDLPASGPIISSNTNQIQQVLTNLVTNAWEAMGKEGGAIRLILKTLSSAEFPVARRFPLDWQPQATAYACLEVEDDGCGIADQDIDQLFDPFFSTKFTGRGMGLPVILGIVRSHSGAIAVASRLGQGSVFRVFFPVTAEAVPQPPAPTAQAPTIQGSGTLLLVEDEPVVLQVVAKALRGVGFAVLTAQDGVEAMEIFRQHQAYEYEELINAIAGVMTHRNQSEPLHEI